MRAGLDLRSGWSILQEHVFAESDQVALGEKVDIILEQGTLITEVKEKHGTKKNI